MDFTEVLFGRRSVRKFESQAVPEETLRAIIRSASRAPSWENAQPWNVYMTSGKPLQALRDVWIEKYASKIKGVSEVEKAHRANFSQRSQETVAAFLADIGEKTGDPSRVNLLKANILLFNAPVVAFLTLPKNYSAWSIFDLGAFSMALMLAAKNEGVDSIPAYEFVKFPEDIRKNLPIPEEETIVMGIGLGYAAKDPVNDYAATRLDVDDFCVFCH